MRLRIVLYVMILVVMCGCMAPTTPAKYHAGQAVTFAVGGDQGIIRSAYSGAFGQPPAYTVLYADKFGNLTDITVYEFEIKVNK